ncbi:MAG: DUF2807 domain-containing protein [Saprospiraceae bacterium]|nr:DUF2807 domain-containing protein [Saprospiraceae bacterium]
MHNKHLGKLALLLLPALLSIVACDPTAIRGNGDLVTEKRDVADFAGVHASIPGKVNVLSGMKHNVEVKVEENLLPYLKTEVESDGNLHVYFSRNVRDVDGLVVTVTMPNLNALYLAGSGEITTQGAFKGQSLQLDVSGSGHIKASDLDYHSVKPRLSGSGHIDLQGEGGIMQANLSGSGFINTLDFPVKDAEVKISGSGVVKVNASATLNVSISGSGEVRYQGSPSIETNISGSGKVVKI